MNIPRPLQLLTFGLVALILFTSVTAVAATNTIPVTRLDHALSSVNINSLKPSTCSGIILTSLVSGSGTLTGTEGNDLILASSGTDTIDGLGGNDCILGGGGVDIINGGSGNDVCLGGAGVDVFLACETQIQ